MRLHLNNEFHVDQIWHKNYQGKLLLNFNAQVTWMTVRYQNGAEFFLSFWYTFGFWYLPVIDSSVACSNLHSHLLLRINSCVSLYGCVSLSLLHDRSSFTNHIVNNAARNGTTNALRHQNSVAKLQVALQGYIVPRTLPIQSTFCNSKCTTFQVQCWYYYMVR